ncbi:MAG TPA: ATP-binding protein [Myxococcota bacterium]|nr:ATP-binding protein [Myxococcota bacterium]
MSAADADSLSSVNPPLGAFISDVVLWLDDRLCILRANEAALRLLRQTREALLGVPLTELVGPSSRKGFAAYVSERSATGGPAQRRVEVRIHHGEVVDLPVELALHALEVEGRRQWVLVAHDLTERRLLRAEKNRTESLEEANSALREAMLHAEQTTRIKTEFLANVSHEIRTPMTAILGFTEVLLEEAQRSAGPAATIDALRTIQRNGDYLLALLNDILDLSKIESGRLEVERVTFSPVAVVREVERLMRVRAEAKAIGFEVEFDGVVPEYVEGDPTRVRQILINLVGNAIKFTEIGTVRLRVQLRDEPGPPRLRFEVIDTGIGITAAERTKLFRPFGQADSSTTRRYGGTGLGLTISKRLTDLLDGTIEVESEPGRGTIFRVDLPAGNLDGVARVAATEPAVAESGEQEDDPRLSGTVLLVEDGPDNRRLIDLLLTRAGVSVVMAENGQQAIERVHEARVSGRSFQLVLMDMQMPVMDGYTATKILRRQGFAAPIVALTAHAMDTERARCISAGCDDFATKPIDRARFYALLRRHLGAAKRAPAP